MSFGTPEIFIFLLIGMMMFGAFLIDFVISAWLMPFKVETQNDWKKCVSCLAQIPKEAMICRHCKKHVPVKYHEERS